MLSFTAPLLICDLPAVCLPIWTHMSLLVRFLSLIIYFDRYIYFEVGYLGMYFQMYVDVRIYTMQSLVVIQIS